MKFGQAIAPAISSTTAARLKRLQPSEEEDISDMLIDHGREFGLQERAIA